MDEEIIEKALVTRILFGVSSGNSPNAWFLYQNLPKEFKKKYTYSDILNLFHELEWNVKVIEVDRVDETEGWNPWQTWIQGNLSKKVIKYRMREGFEHWSLISGLLDKIIEHLHQEYPVINFTPQA